MKKVIMLIDADEAIKLTELSASITLDAAVELTAACRRKINYMYADSDPLFKAASVVQTVFEAGRIQGIREERNRRKGRGAI